MIKRHCINLATFTIIAVPRSDVVKYIHKTHILFPTYVYIKSNMITFHMEHRILPQIPACICILLYMHAGICVNVALARNKNPQNQPQQQQKNTHIRLMCACALVRMHNICLYT